MLVMRIKEVSASIDDYCLAVPLNILGFIAGDFDGDVLSMFALKGNKLIQKANAVFNPRTNMQISRTDGEFNMRGSLIKDQTIALLHFNRMHEVEKAN